MAEPASIPERKVSRYRSQRQKAQRAHEYDYDDVPQVPQVDSSPQDDGVARSKSRYHRKRGNTGAGAADDRGRVGTSHGQSNAYDQGYDDRNSSSERYDRPSTAKAPPSRHGTQRPDARRHISPPNHPHGHDLRRNPSFEPGSDREQTHRVAPVIQDFSQIAPSQPTGELFPPPRPEPAEPTPPPVRRDGPPTSDQIKATRSTSALPKFEDEEEDHGGCFGLFKRKKSDSTPAAEMARPLSDHRPKYIVHGGGGVMPGSDAPVSAVNTGDRKVLIECGRSKMIFPVKPTTTGVDLIRSASTTMSERIDVKSAVLLENFASVGVQRPLRRYEYVRNVMNSWDTDRQNSLLLVDPRTGSSEPELSLAGAPKHRPEESSWLLTYSQRPGKWEKRFVTLKSDGQITCQKDPDKIKDQFNVCHLSDYDIYTPTPEKIKKKIKPPKKACLAIKSQQKSSMFETTQNFVHFFCTNDRRTADDFYDAVQNWRSWYLVNVLGEGEKPQSPSNPEKEGGISTSFTAHGHRKMDSTASHYQLGSFKPLMDTDQIGRRPSQRQAPRAARITSNEERQHLSDESQAPARRPSTRKQTMTSRPKLAEDEPLVNLARQPTSDGRRASIEESRPEEFNSSGLLGRSYSTRQREAAAREAKQQNPFTNGSNLLSAGTEGPRRQTSTRQNRRGGGPTTDLGRSNSTRAANGPPDHKPLVDLTPHYREPPQHNPKGRGHHPDQIGPGGLIDSATSPDDPLGIPPAHDWRGRNAVQSNNAATAKPRSNSRSGADHQRSLRPTASQRRPATARPSTARAANSETATSGKAFTGEGLLAASQDGWGGGTKGRGVMDGSRAKGPMVDLGLESQFAQGSLLNRVEREQGVAGPVIER